VIHSFFVKYRTIIFVFKKYPDILVSFIFWHLVKQKKFQKNQVIILYEVNDQGYGFDVVNQVSRLTSLASCFLKKKSNSILVIYFFIIWLKKYFLKKSCYWTLENSYTCLQARGVHSVLGFGRFNFVFFLSKLTWWIIFNNILKIKNYNLNIFQLLKKIFDPTYG